MVFLKKAQAAVEVLSYGSFFLLIFVVAVAIFFQMQSQELSRSEYAYAQQTAYQFADQIQIAFVAGSGFWEVVRIPPELLGKNYNFVVSRSYGQQAINETGFVYVNWGNGKSVSAPTVTTSYEVSPVSSGQIYYGTNNFVEINNTAGCVNISNSEGTIIFARVYLC